MAKGVTNQPLAVWVAHQWYARPEILKLMRAGHRVYDMSKITCCCGEGPDEPNLIIHPAAGWTEDLFDYLPAALTRARARRRTK
jgi:hypothetical protein